MYACSDYLKRQMERYPVLDDKEQLELLKQAQEGDDNARDDLILCNLRLVRTIAQQLGVPTHWEMDDLISEGIQGLSYAIDKFDLEKSVKTEHLSSGMQSNGKFLNSRKMLANRCCR